MVHDTTARREARGLKKKAQEMATEARALEGIEDAESLVVGKMALAVRLQEQARELKEKARLEDVTVWEDCIVKQTNKGERKYGRWLAGWREDGKPRKVYLGSCRKLSHAEALEKARKVKKEALEI